ncbi:MAG: hypothetical protein ABA06_03730 [Parcubacteria bacterium C7867-001]|nr:MAG: hypothetical protein ABA06_03730 [Parcubacteria bacterium C7867-001]
MYEAGTSATTPIHFLNLEFFLRLLYDTAVHLSVPGGIMPFLTSVWNLVTMVGYLIALVSLISLVYAIVRLKQVYEADAVNYTTLDSAHAENMTEHARWNHILTLVESPLESDWRQSIIEADIMLNDVLEHHGYEGETLGERLKQARFESINEAWEAHKVRNEIAHQGSTFKVDDTLAYRTIQKYKRVFEELKAI